MKASTGVSPTGLTKKEETAIREEARYRCVEDLHYLAKHVLGYDRVTDHYHKRMAQEIDTPHYKFKLLLHPRGHFKSTLGTESRSVQRLLKNPNERILITNAKLDNSRKFLRTIANHFNSNAKLRWLWRNHWIEKYATEYDRQDMGEKLDWVKRDTQDEFTMLRPYAGREASITTGAVDASMVSQHYSLVIADDLINREYVRTQDMVEKSVLYFKDLLDLLDPDGVLEVIGTRWSHMDLYGWIIEEFGGRASIRVPEGYDLIPENVFEEQKKVPEEEREWLISIQPCYNTDGTPVFPEEFTPKVLKDLERAKGPYEFGSQYLLNPTPSEHQKFREEWINKLDIMPNASELTVCITVDPAMSLEDRADNTAMVVCGYDKSNYMYLLDARDEKLSEHELPEALLELVAKWMSKAKTFLPVGFESVGFQQIYVYNIERLMRERGMFFSIEQISRRKQSKHERILRLVPRIKNGFYAPKSLWVQSYSGREPAYDIIHRLKWQLTRFPFADKDDLADALADQLEIATAESFPMDRPMPREEEKRDFIHRSILEDRGKARKRESYIHGVVR